MRRLLPILLLLLASPAAAAEVQPFFTHNLQPTVQVYGLPATEGGRLLPAGRGEGRLVLEAASLYTDHASGPEQILFDGELYRTTLALRYGIAPDWELGIDLPLVGQAGGFLDDFIKGWHNFFDLPQGGRDTAVDNRLDYRYQHGGTTELTLTDSGAGLGDVQLLAGWQLWSDGPQRRRALALRGGIKLPTGDSDHLYGSGSTDLHLRLTATDAATLAPLHLTLFASGGLLHLGDGDVLPARQRHTVLFGSLGCGWRPLDLLALKLQLDGHSAFYHSALPELGDPSAQLVMGGSLFFGDDWTLDIGVGEDIAVSTAPDVVFHLALAGRF